MALFDCATVKRINNSYRTPMKSYNGVVFHIAVSNALFPAYAPGTVAHFYVRKNGVIAQEIDTAFQSGANLQGNPYFITVETEGGVGSDVNGSWTPEQVNALAVLSREANRRHGIPLRLMESSRLGEKGLGWHRLGIDGNFPATGLLAGRLQRGGGQTWSRSRGKVCPTDNRILQVPSVLRIAQNTDNTPPAQEEDVMATKQEVADEIFNRTFTTPGGSTTNLAQLIRWHDNGTNQVIESVKAVVPVIVAGVLNAPINRSGAEGTTSLAAMLAWNDRNIEGTREVVRNTGAQVQSTVEANANRDADAVVADVTKQVLADVEGALKGVTLTPTPAAK